jgi:hypothetical protein
VTYRICDLPDCLARHHAHGLCWKHDHRRAKYGDPLGGPTFAGAPLAHFQQFLYTITDECKIWPFACDSDGYGKLWINGVFEKANVLACLAFNGPKPDPSMYAAHGPCHTTSCWNGAHQSWKTPRENAQDKRRDGTHRTGVLVPTSKLTESEVLEILKRHKSGELQKYLAIEYKVSNSTISDIVNHKVWKHLSIQLPTPVERSEC